MSATSDNYFVLSATAAVLGRYRGVLHRLAKPTRYPNPTALLLRVAQLTRRTLYAMQRCAFLAFVGNCSFVRCPDVALGTSALKAAFIYTCPPLFTSVGTLTAHRNGVLNCLQSWGVLNSEFFYCRVVTIRVAN